MKYFIAGATARTAADLAEVHRNSAIHFFHKLRSAIASAEAVLAQIRSGLGSAWIVESLLNDDDRKKIDANLFEIPFNICVMRNK